MIGNEVLVRVHASTKAGRLLSVVGRTYALRDIVEAHRYADTGHKVGNVVVLIGDTV